MLRLALLLIVVALSSAEHTLGSVQADDAAYRESQKPSTAGAEAQALAALLQKDGTEHKTATAACTEAYVTSADKSREGSVLPPLDQDKRWQLMAKIWHERQTWLGAADTPGPAPPPGSTAASTQVADVNADVVNLEHIVSGLVSFFDAPHLRPTLVLAQMKSGNALACHSLLTLMKHLQNHRELLSNKDEL
jgi:hypothetical protein